MDLYGQIQAINNTPDRIRARQLHRARRHELIHSRIAEAIGQTAAREAALQWSLYSHDPEEDAGTPIGSQHPGQAALIATRKALSEFRMPSSFDIRFTGMHRFSGRGAYEVDDGILYVEATLHSLSGVDRVVDIPVIVKNGRVLEPVAVMDRGVIRAMTQHTFDDLLGQGTFMAAIPQRQNMYSPPPEDRRPPTQVPIVRPGMFGLAPINKQLTAAYVKSAMRGHYVTTLPDFAPMQRQAREPAPDHLDWAERPLPEVMAGDDVTLTKGIDVVGRDGQRWHIASGTRGQAQRDMCGNGEYYYVFFPELGMSVKVRSEVLR